MSNIKKNETFKLNIGNQYSTKTLKATQDINIKEFLQRFNKDILQKNIYLDDIDLYEYVDGIGDMGYRGLEKHHFNEVQFLSWLIQNSFVEKEIVRTFELFNPENSHHAYHFPFEVKSNGVSIIDLESENNDEYPITLTEPLTFCVITDKNNKKPLETDRAYPEEMEYYMESILEENQHIIKVKASNVIYHEMDNSQTGYFTIINDKKQKKENKLKTPEL